MLFKDDRTRLEWDRTNPLLKLMAETFANRSVSRFFIIPIVTRIFEPIAGSSGVHEAGRGIDFRDEHGGLRIYTDDQVRELLNYMNEGFKRNDGKLTAIHHAFNSGPKHVHIQISERISTYAIG